METILTAQQERRNRNLVNEHLTDMGKTYHQSLPLSDICTVLEMHGFQSLTDAIYCGRDGRSSEQVGARTWFVMSWHKMEETGRYEVVAYVS